MTKTKEGVVGLVNNCTWRSMDQQWSLDSVSATWRTPADRQRYSFWQTHSQWIGERLRPTCHILFMRDTVLLNCSCSPTVMLTSIHVGLCANSRDKWTSTYRVTEKRWPRQFDVRGESVDSVHRLSSSLAARPIVYSTRTGTYAYCHQLVAPSLTSVRVLITFASRHRLGQTDRHIDRETGREQRSRCYTSQLAVRSTCSVTWSPVTYLIGRCFYCFARHR